MTTAVATPKTLQTSGDSYVPSSSAPTFNVIPLELLRESELNTRKHFDPVKLKELKASIAKSGVLTPLLVRPRYDVDEKGSFFEIAAGHRRYRAAQLAGVAAVPCVVREMDDATFLEVLTIENLQREDVHPLEEAQGYKNLLTLEGYDIGKIADRVGKSESYVYDRMKLLQLTKDAQKLFLENRFSAGHAILLARLSKGDQKRALGLGEGEDLVDDGGMWESEGDAHPALGLEDPAGIEDEHDGRLKPVSVRQLQAWIDNHVRFTAPDPQTPHLFPDTAENLAQAQAAKAKVIEISRDHMLKDDAKDPEGKRTYCVTSWTRADGQAEIPEWWDEEDRAKAQPSKTCDHSVLGVVVAGRGRGESFQVCIDKKRCTVHYKAEIQERNRREREREKEASKPAKKTAAPSEPTWQREQRLREERKQYQQARWAKGRDAVLTAIAAKLKKTLMHSTDATGKYIWQLIDGGLYGMDDAAKIAAKYGIGRGMTPGDWMRHVIMCALIVGLEDDYNDPADVQKELDALKLKVNLKQLLDAANPESPPKPKAKAKKKKS